MTVATQNTTKIVTGKVRLSYVHLFEAFSNDPDRDPQFSCVILIPKSDKKTLTALKAAQEAAVEAGKNTKFNGKVPANLKQTLHDGDEEADLERNPEYEGHMFMSVVSKTQPGIVDKNVQPILDSTEVYSGCYARVSINAFAYNTQGNRGVSFGLNHVQKVADGDYLGGRSRAEDDFDSYQDEADESLI